MSTILDPESGSFSMMLNKNFDRSVGTIERVPESASRSLRDLCPYHAPWCSLDHRQLRSDGLLVSFKILHYAVMSLCFVRGCALYILWNKCRSFKNHDERCGDPKVTALDSGSSPWPTSCCILVSDIQLSKCLDSINQHQWMICSGYRLYDELESILSMRSRLNTRRRFMLLTADKTSADLMGHEARRLTN